MPILISTKSPSESRYPFDYYKIVQKLPGAEVFKPLAEGVFVGESTVTYAPRAKPRLKS